MQPRKWLSDMRKDLGKTQEEIATAAGIKRPYYSQIELGSRSPSVGVAKRLSKIIGCDWTLFFANNCSELEQKTITA
ncbi:helix-turn-helix transcriptional regulator [Bacillus safensis]|uniref:helix-turn-helix transcriptional regulator n=1 Tax=Bacillus safensis TaxID=561879 RepID=UPI001CD25BF9|nr:helix-turn-helix transcriptional regulator [Bacillus safensis]